MAAAYTFLKRNSPGALSLCSCVLFLWATVFSSGAAATLEVDHDFYSLSDQFAYYEDSVGALQIHHILGDSLQYPFISSAESKPKTTFKPVWLKLKLEFLEEALGKKYILQADAQNFYDLRVYRPDLKGRYTEWVTGNHYRADTREIDSLRYAFEVQAAAEPMTIYIRYVGGPGTHTLPWSLVEESAFAVNTREHNYIGIACFAAIGALLFFNLVVALSVRRTSYLFYATYVASVTLALLTHDGVAFYYFWPDIPMLNDRAMHSFNLLSASLRLLAILSFLGMAEEAPYWNRAGKFVVGMLLVTLLVLNLVGVTNLPPLAATLAWAVGIIFGFLVCIVGIMHRVKLAIPLFITLLAPSVFAFAQGSLSVAGAEIAISQMHFAKIGFVVHVVLFSLCLAAQIRHQAESHRIALHDTLTGLPQISLLRERFEWAANLSKRQKWRMALLFVDLDGFKKVNDTLGHAAGDELLLQAAERMKRSVRKTDFVARIGGDEFVILLHDVPERSSIITATTRLLDTLGARYELDGEEAKVTASMGVAVFDGGENDLALLLRQADEAMYESKKRGKNTFSIFGETAPLKLVSYNLSPALT